MNLIEEVTKRIAKLNAERAKLTNERNDVQRSIRAIVDGAERRGDSALTESEARAVKDGRAELAEIDERAAKVDTDLQRAHTDHLELLETGEARNAAARGGPKGGGKADVRFGSEPRVYGQSPGLYLKDLVGQQLNRNHTIEAQERLDRHAREVEVEARAIGRTTDTELGFFVPPLYAIEDYAEIVRAGRPFADLLNPRPLPGGVDQVKIPRLTTGTKVRVQAGDKAAVTTQDVVSAETTAELVTVAGYIDVAVQAIEQSPVDTQEILFSDLEQDYALQVDTLLLSGTGPGASQPLGALSLGGTAIVTYTDATATPPEFYRKVGEAISTVNTNRKLPPDAIIMHPRRWWWLVSYIGADGRPFAGFANSFPQNVGAYAERVVAEARGGTMLGLPVFLDANLPINLGTGTDQDIVIVARIADARLWEGTARMQARPVVDAASENLLVRLLFYRYVIALPGRYPTSWAKIDGTGLTTPVFS